MDAFLKRFDPAYTLNRQSIEQHTQHVLQNASLSRSGGVNRGVVYTVPIVFHVLHEGENVGDSTNISDAQIYSCIAALNRDFRRNGDDGGIAQSGPLGADAEIEFCLARRDPSGNFTTGITRHDMSGVQGYLDSGVYHSGTWRSDASMKAMVQWNPSQYINVWVVNKIKSTTNIYQGGGGGVIGYQWITNKGFVIDLFSGLTFKDRSTTYTYDNAALNAADPNNIYDSIGDKLFSEKYIDFKTEDSKGSAFRFGINIGYKF